jgi:hypothetical protein
MMLESTHQEVEAALSQIREKHKDVAKAMKKAYGYAVFPAVSRGSAVLGGTHGRGEVFEQGQLIGYATVSQLTLGVQLGGQTFSEVVLFKSKEALYRFKRGRVTFSASASLVMLKAGVCAVSNFEPDVVTRAFSRGGMQVELGMGFQRFHFRSVQEQTLRERPPKEEQEARIRDGRESEAQDEDEHPKRRTRRERLSDASAKAAEMIRSRSRRADH